MLIYLFCLMCSLEGKAKTEEELKRADAVVLTYDCDKTETLNRLQTFWIQELRRLKVCHQFVLL